jgi:hypothetical protein
VLSCVSLQVFSLVDGGLTRTNRNSFSLKKKKRIMAGARGCFNCGGCAWCFRVVVVVVVVRVAVACLVYRRSMYLPHSPLSPSPPFLPFFSFLVRAWCGADGDRVFFHTLHTYRPGAIKKKFIVPKKIWHRRVHRVSPGADLGRGQMDTRPQTAPRRAHLPGKRPFSIDRDGLRETIILN